VLTSGFKVAGRLRPHSKLRNKLTQKDREWTLGLFAGGSIKVSLFSGASAGTSLGVGATGAKS